MADGITEINPGQAEEMKKQALARGVPSAIDRQDRITCVFSLTHQSLDGDPVEIPVRFERYLDTKEQPWPRRISVGPQRQGLLTDCWVRDPGYAVLHNRTSVSKSVQPTQAEIDAVAKQIVEIWLPGAAVPLLVHPRGFQLLILPDFTGVEIVCQEGVANCTLTVFGK